jgi:hypothetical protein
VAPVPKGSGQVHGPARERSTNSAGSLGRSLTASFGDDLRSARRPEQLLPNRNRRNTARHERRHVSPSEHSPTDRPVRRHPSGAIVFRRTRADTIGHVRPLKGQPKGSQRRRLDLRKLPTHQADNLTRTL